MRINEENIGSPLGFGSVPMRATFVLFTVSVIGMTFAAGQEGGRRAAAHQVNDMREWAEKHFPYLVKPDFARLELARMLPELSDGPGKLKAPFRVNEPVSFRLLITNGSEKKMYLPIAGPYEHSRPRLVKGEETVPYRLDIEKEVQNVETQRGYWSVKYMELGPGGTFTEIVRLKDWYETLQPGVYRLVVRHRFILGGDWVDSPPINFEVIP
jgi:hypothetical protein